MRRALLLATSLAPALAAACPYCAGREGESAFGTVALLGVAILAPFLIGGVAFVAIRRVIAQDQESHEPPATHDGLAE